VEAFKLTRTAVKLAKDKSYQLTVTGHSLGAWLADQSIYYCHRNLGHPDVKAITFDSPGSDKTLSRFRQANIISANDSHQQDLEKLGIVNYLSSPTLSILAMST
jgi:hypothetical protein